MAPVHVMIIGEQDHHNLKQGNGEMEVTLAYGL